MYSKFFSIIFLSIVAFIVKAQNLPTHILQPSEITITEDGTIDNYTGPTEVGTFIIPESLGVKRISADCFNYLQSTSIHFPSTLRIIDDDAFFSCVTDSVIFEDGTEYIGDCAFENYYYNDAKRRKEYTKYITYLKLPNTLKYIAEKTFCCGLHIDELIIPNSVTHIGREAFSNCLIKHLTLGENVDTILTNAFAFNDIEELEIPNKVSYIAGFNSNQIKKLFIPKSVKTIGWHAFSGNPLEEVIISEGVEIIGDLAFRSRTQWANSDGEHRNRKNGCVSKLTNIKIPNTVKKIRENAFAECQFLSEITIGQSVDSIGSEAFKLCGVNEIILPQSVKHIGDNAFEQCENLKSVSLPEGLLTIGRQAFLKCSKLESIEIPNTVKKIPFEAFRDNFNLEKITLHEGLEEIGERAFFYAYEVEMSALPKTLKLIKPSAFYGVIFTSHILPCQNTNQRWYYFNEKVENIIDVAVAIDGMNSFGQTTENKYGYVRSDYELTKTPIIDINNSNNSIHTYYDLNGRKTTKPTHGFYIKTDKQNRNIKTIKY